MQLCRARFYRRELGLSNTFYATKLIFDTERPEIVDFHRRLFVEGDSSSHKPSQVSSLYVLSETDEPDSGSVEPLKGIIQSNDVIISLFKAIGVWYSGGWNILDIRKNYICAIKEGLVLF